jgi:hypothetical protein
MHKPGEFPNFFLPNGRVCGVEIPVTRWRKPAGSVSAIWQFKPMTPKLQEELVDLLADLIVADLRAHPPSSHDEAPQPTCHPEPQTKSRPRRRSKRRA